MTYKPPFTQTIATFAVQLNYTTGTTVIDLITAGANGGLVKSLTASSDDSAPKIVRLLTKLPAESDMPLGALSIPAGAGNDGTTPRVDLLSDTLMPGLAIDAGLKRQLLLSPNEKVRVCLAANASAGKLVTVRIAMENY